jgi:hypothetical protein
MTKKKGEELSRELERRFPCNQNSSQSDFHMFSSLKCGHCMKGVLATLWKSKQGTEMAH